MSKTIRSARSLSLFAAAAALLLLTMTACGSSGSKTGAPASAGATSATTGSTGSAGSTGSSGSTATGTSSAGADAFIKRVFNGTVTASQFDQTALDSFAIADQQLTPTQQQLLFRCLGVETCDTGHGNLVVGLAETNGVNGLRRMWRLEATAQAIATPQVSKVIYLDAHDDLPTFLSNFKSLISQKVNMIIGAYDFGAAILPVAKEAMSQGIDVISLEAIPGAKAGVDYGVQVGVVDECQTWTQEAQTAVKALGPDKTYGLYTGPAGNPYFKVWQPCATKVLDAAGWTQVVTGYTDWTPQGEQQAGTALIASGKNPDAIFYDYNSEDLIQPFLQAHKTPPAVFGQSSDAALWKLYQTTTAAGNKLTVYVEGTAGSWTMRTAVTAGVEKAEKQNVPTDISYPFVLTSLANLVGTFNPAYPAQTPMPPSVPPSWASQALSS